MISLDAKYSAQDSREKEFPNKPSLQHGKCHFHFLQLPFPHFQNRHFQVLKQKFKTTFKHQIYPQLEGKMTSETTLDPLKSGFLMRKSEELGLLSKSPLLPILGLTFPEPDKPCQNFPD